MLLGGLMVWSLPCFLKMAIKKEKNEAFFRSLAGLRSLPDEGAVVLVFSRGAARINDNDSYLVVALKMAAGVLNCQTLTLKWIWLHSVRQKLMLECINHIFLWSISHLCVSIRPKTSKKTLFLGILKLFSACSFQKNYENDSSCIQGHIPIHRPINALLIFMTALWMYE